MKKRIFASSIITVVLLFTPYIGNVLRALNTLFHESGHALVNLLTQGEVKSISLFYNTEGVTETYTSSWIGSVLTSTSGYVFSSLVLLGLSYLWSKKKYTWINGFVLAFLALNLLLWVRNLYGIFWILGVGTLLLYGIRSKKESVAPMIAMGFLIILLFDSCRASLDILYLSYQTPGEAGDASNLQKATFIPTIFWGCFFVLQSFVAASFSVKWMIKK